MTTSFTAAESFNYLNHRDVRLDDLVIAKGNMHNTRQIFLNFIYLCVKVQKKIENLAAKITWYATTR